MLTNTTAEAGQTQQAHLERVTARIAEAKGSSFIPTITVGPVTRTPPSVAFGKRYGRPWKSGRRILWMFRNGQRVRWFTAAGEQVGPELTNVFPAVCYADAQGWRQL